MKYQNTIRIFYMSQILRKEIQLNLDKAEIALERSKEQIENRIKIQNEEVKQKNSLSNVMYLISKKLMKH